MVVGAYCCPGQSEGGRHDPYSVQSAVDEMLFVLMLVALFAEAILIRVYVSEVQARPAGLVDALMTVISSPQFWLMKALMLIPAGLFMLVVLLIVSGLIDNIPASLLILVFAVSVLFFTQVWTVFAFCDFFNGEPAMAEALENAWRLV
jgi:hypothetical protein